MRWYMRRRAAALILIASLLSFPVARPIFAGPVEDSIKAYRGGDYKTAYQLVQPHAEKGDAEAQFILGYLYDGGKGVPQDYAEAAKWYGRAAKQGNKAARHNLGLINDQGQVSKDRAEMGKWHRGVAEPGSAAARSNLVLKGNQVRGVPKENPEVEKWHRGAADPENVTARSKPDRKVKQVRAVPKENPEVEEEHRGGEEWGYVSA